MAGIPSALPSAYFRRASSALFLTRSCSDWRGDRFYPADLDGDDFH